MGRRGRARSKPENLIKRKSPELPKEYYGGNLVSLSESQKESIHLGAIKILTEIGVSGASDFLVTLMMENGAKISDDRVLLSESLIEKCLSNCKKNIILHDQKQAATLTLEKDRVYMGSGGAAPLVFDIKENKYRPARLKDLQKAARLVEKLDNYSFFSRSLVPTEILDPRILDLYTALVSLSATEKHIMTSVSNHKTVKEIAEICYLIAGGKNNFKNKPFLSLNINYVVPPLRLDPEACKIMAEAIKYGIPVMANVFGQRGASSPVNIIGSVCQTLAETLLGVIICTLLDQDSLFVCGPRAMITDLRTGGMAGGSGEQAQTTSLLSQMMRYYNLPNSSIAGATDSNIPDFQAGYEKALSISVSAQSGANIITQAGGMLSGLMGVSLESYVLDNDMCGSVLRSMSKINFSEELDDFLSIQKVVKEDMHFLGEPETLARMSTDFQYPLAAKRLSPENWMQNKEVNILNEAKQKMDSLISEDFSSHLDTSLLSHFAKKYGLELTNIKSI
mgnify:FL=1